MDERHGESLLFVIFGTLRHINGTHPYLGPDARDARQFVEMGRVVVVVVVVVVPREVPWKDVGRK